MEATALFKWVKNSVLNTQLSKGSGSEGELTPNENQSSFSVDVPTYLIAPRGIVRSEEMDNCRFTRAETIIYTALFVSEVSVVVIQAAEDKTYKDQDSRHRFTRSPKFRDKQLAST